MIKLLSTIFLLILPIQLALISLGYGDTLLYQVAVPSLYIFVIVLIQELFLIFLIFKLFSKIETNIFSGIKFSWYQKLNTLAILLIIVWFNIYLLSRFELTGMLNSIQNQQGLGLSFKLGTVIIPALYALTLSAFRSNLKITLALTILILLVSIANSVYMLTKAPMISFLLILCLMAKEKIIAWRHIALFIVLSIVGISLVYLGRSSGATLETKDMLSAVILRVPLFFEGSFIFDHVIRLGVIQGTLLNIHEFVTSDIFNLDSTFTGVAPGFLGFFWAFFGVFGSVCGYAFLFIVRFLIRFLVLDGAYKKIRLFLYFVWCFEAVPFFIDGYPAFIISTTGYRMFYALSATTILVSFMKLLSSTKNHKNHTTNVTSAG